MTGVERRFRHRTEIRPAPGAFSRFVNWGSLGVKLQPPASGFSVWEVNYLTVGLAQNCRGRSPHGPQGNVLNVRNWPGFRV